MGGELCSEGDRVGFESVAMQMLAVSLPIVLGWAINKLGLLNPELDAGLSRLVMNIGLPCTILASLHDAESLPSVETTLLIVAATLLTYVVAVVVAFAVTALLRVPASARAPYRFAISFGNCGFIGLPVISAVFGSNALLYAAITLVPANVALFGVGALMFSDGAADAERGGWKRKARRALASLKTPTLIMSVFVLILALLGVGNLGIVGDAASIVGQMTTPLALLVTGSSIAMHRVRSMLANPRAYVAAAARLLVVPLASLLVVRVLPLDPYVLGIVVVDCAMPVATVGTLFCLQHHVDVKPMLQVTFLSIVGAILSIPLVAVAVGV